MKNILKNHQPKPFGFFWEIVHLESGEVVNDGFSRDPMEIGEFPHKFAGFVLRVRALFEANVNFSGA